MWPMAIQTSSVAVARRRALSLLQQVGNETPVYDVNVLLGQVMRLKPAEVVLRYEDDLSAQQLKDFDQAIRRRTQHEPVAYITGTKGFRRIDVLVNSSVLVPRPETELLVQVTLDLWDEVGPCLVVDVGTGSGAVGLALAEERPTLHVLGTDVSISALDVAVQNAKRLTLLDRVCFSRTTGLAGVELSDALVTANLPYIPSGEISGLPPDILEWEPRTALDGGADGLTVIRLVVSQLEHSNAVGAIFEVGINQSSAVARLLVDAGFSATSIHYDLSGYPRVVAALRPSESVSRV